jgi:glycosyltransferase involved in cell wall biosynthesis|tara:strand:- start:1198 stop:2334 length:1137 start_codon:yes stop_codon:yes gene_type:complete
MKICIISDVFYPYLMGGAERRYWEISKRLAKKHDVHVYTMRWYDYPKEEEVFGVKIHRLNVPKGLYTKGRRSIGDALRFAFSLFPIILKRHKFDIIEANQFPFLHLFPAKIIAMRETAPLIITWHEVWGKYWDRYMENALYRTIGKTIEQISSYLPNKIVAVSTKTKDNLIKKLGVNPMKIDIIPNGINLRYINTIKSKKIKNRVLYAGRLLPHKNLDVLINAMPKVLEVFPDATLNIVGEGPSKGELEDMANSLGINNKVKFLGQIDYKEVIKQIKSASIFVQPSTREGFGISIVEAMACKTPVIGVNARNSSVSEIINGENGILCELNEISTKIKEVLTSDSLRIILIKNGYEYSANMDWQRRFEEINSTYKKCLN